MSGPPRLAKPRTAIIPMITSSLSFLGSYLLFREMICDLDQSRTRTRGSTRSSIIPQSRRPIARVLLCIALVDGIGSLARGLSTIPFPADDWYSYGNTESCEAQAFFIVLADSAGPLYMGFLTWLFLCNVKECSPFFFGGGPKQSSNPLNRIKLPGPESYVHILIWLTAAALATLPLPLDLYNPKVHYCGIFPYPAYCLGRPELCQRGMNPNYRPYFYFYVVFPFWPSFFAASTIMCRIYAQVKKAECSAATHHEQETGSTWSSSFSNDEERDDQEQSAPNNDHGNNRIERQRHRSRAVAREATLWLCAFFIAHSFRLIAIVIKRVSGVYHPVFDVLWADVLAPSQGIYNALVLLRTRHDFQSPEGRLFQTLVRKCYSCVSLVLGCCCWPSSMCGDATSQQWVEQAWDMFCNIALHHRHDQEESSSSSLSSSSSSSQMEQFNWLHSDLSKQSSQKSSGQEEKSSGDRGNTAVANGTGHLTVRRVECSHDDMMFLPDSLDLNDGVGSQDDDHRHHRSEALTSTKIIHDDKILNLDNVSSVAMDDSGFSSIAKRERKATILLGSSSEKDKNLEDGGDCCISLK